MFVSFFKLFQSDVKKKKQEVHLKEIQTKCTDNQRTANEDIMICYNRVFKHLEQLLISDVCMFWDKN